MQTTYNLIKSKSYLLPKVEQALKCTSTSRENLDYFHIFFGSLMLGVIGAWLSTLQELLPLGPENSMTLWESLGKHLCMFDPPLGREFRN